MDITPYATKNEKGSNETNVKLRLKLLMMSGTRGPRILVINEITKNTMNIKITIK